MVIHGSTSPIFSLGAVILAAGASTRMGRPKMLLSWGETSVLGHLISQWTRLFASQITVVCAGGGQDIAAELNRLQFPPENRIQNPEPERGMFSSIQCAAQWESWQPGLTHWAIVLGDQPHLQPATLQALRQCAATHPQRICQPSYRGHRHHPVVLPKNVFEQLKEAPEKNLQRFLERFAELVTPCERDDPGLVLDLDSPADYERAQQAYFGSGHR